MADLKDIKTEELKKDWIKESGRVDINVLKNALNYAVDNISENLYEMRDKAPFAAGKNGVYPMRDLVKSVLSWDWVASFYTGMIWLAYDITGDEKYKKAGLYQNTLYREALDKTEGFEHHDIGFLYSLSAVAGYKLTGDEYSKETGILAARELLKQYVDKCGIFQRLGRPEDPDAEGRGHAIIDCCMNLPLLYWASQVTGESEFYDKAYKHIKNASRYLVNKDGSTHQGMYFDVETGELLKTSTHQGDGHEGACWSRGQAWAIYGFALSYGYTGDKELLEYAKICANYFLNRLQSDNTPNWDFWYRSDDDQRDTSAAGCAVCGFLEIARNLPITDPMREQYEAAALTIMHDLTKKYLYTREESKNALLKDGVYGFKDGMGVAEPVIWGDYYYMEALTRILHTHKIFW